MGEYDFTYEVPDNFQDKLIKFLQQNGGNDLALILRHCCIEYEEIGLAYYAGLRGDTWNKKALDFTVERTGKNINSIKLKERLLSETIQRILKPSSSGYLLRNIDYIINEDTLEITLPEEQGESFEILSNDIYDALRRNEPTLVLDRLHTYSTKFLRDICNKHGIPIDNAGTKKYPLHNLAGALAKYYRGNSTFDSEFVEQTLKASISTFEKYNEIRNNKSYAHDNNVLNNVEATYVVTVIVATLTLIHKIENL